MIAKILDVVINMMRWPCAIFILLSLPALLKSYGYFNFMTVKFYSLFAGAVFFLFTVLSGGYNMRKSMQIIAHELTHTVFALLTLHNVGRLRLNPDGSGGSMQHEGRGNWIITLTPYFFPLFAFLYMLVMPPLLQVCGKSWVLYAILGYFLAYYWEIVLSQTHREQTDIIKEGYLFSGIIIVGANLYVTGCIFAFAGKLWKGTEIYSRLVWQLNVENYNTLRSLITPYFQ